MIQQSDPELLILHAVRLLGFASLATIAEHAGTSYELTGKVICEADSAGWLQHFEFADLKGWSLTETGKAENQRQLATEREEADPDGRIMAIYREFLPLNGRLLRAVTDWQLKPAPNNRLATNDHTDRAWDRRILSELGSLNAALAPLDQRLAEVLTRFAGYAARFDTALGKARNGHHHWVDQNEVDSCHRVWFQLHEDLIATLGINRGAEPPAA